MYRNKKYESRLNHYLASRVSSSSAYIRMDLRSFWYESNSEDDAHKLARRFRNEINQHFYGKRARRFGSTAGLFIVSSFHAEPHPHLHIICQIPHDKLLKDIQAFLERFCKKHAFIHDTYHIEETRNVHLAQQYNARDGESTIIDF